MIKITDSLIAELSQKAGTSPRKRCNYNFHEDYDAPIQRMLNVAQPGTYIRPHKHENPDKIEVFIILKGAVMIVEFDDLGRVTDHLRLDTKKGAKGVEIPPRIWHAFIALEPGSALYEVKEGPYNKDSDKNFAPWAPEEGTKEALEFNERILKKIMG